MPDQETVLGVDIGTTAIKAALLVKGTNGYAAKLLAIEPIKLLDDEGKPTGVEAQQEALENLVDKHGLKNSRCALSVGGPDVAPRYFSFPQLSSDEEIQKAVEFEARDIIPFDLGEAVLDWQAFPSDPQNPKTEGVFVACKREYLNLRFEMARAARLQPVIVDTDGLSLSNAFLEAGGGIAPERPTLLLNIGHRFTNLAVIAPSGRAYIRDLEAGGDRLTKAIQDQYQLDPVQAEALKTGGVLGEPNTPENLARLQERLRPLLEDGCGELVQYVRDTISFMVGQHYIDTVGEVWVTGGAASFPGLPAYLAEAFGVPATGWNPLADISLSAVEEGNNPARADMLGPRYATAIGLAMRPDVG